ITPTYTWTRTVTMTLTSTFTRTNTPLDSVTFTRTLTLTWTSTMTPSATPTITITNTRTSTATLLPTQTFTITPTATATLIPDKEVLKIENVVIYSNPYNPGSGKLKIQFDLTQRCKLIKLRIFTTGFRLIKQITQPGNYYVGENNIEIDSIYLQDLANGVYYIQLEAINMTGESIKRKPSSLVILR
ncbi:MAG: hypothetical protein N3E50_09175, partial [Candidatus Goldbacteria bacterium]|nr:hypothetical protein [Candidatus Goldiibacteriota bacterium]